MIFEEMKHPERKDAFLRRCREAVNSDPAEVEAMAAYILTDRFDADLQRLIEGDWFFEPPNLILLRKGKSQKRRKVYSFTDENRIILQYLAFMLLNRYDGQLPDSLYSSRTNKPYWQMYRTVRRSDPHREKYVIKADIHKFGESIDPEILEGTLEQWLSDEPEVRRFIMWLVTRNVYRRKGKLEKGFTSVLPGNPTVAFLENIFLTDIDRFMAENVRICSRYCDDIFMLCEDAGTAERLMNELRERIALFGLSLNEEKSGVVLPGEAFDLLGIRFTPNAMDIADNTYAKACGRLKHRADNLCRRVKEGCGTDGDAYPRILLRPRGGRLGELDGQVLPLYHHDGTPEAPGSPVPGMPAVCRHRQTDQRQIPLPLSGNQGNRICAACARVLQPPGETERGSARRRDMTRGIKTDQIERKELARMPKKWDNHFVGGAPFKPARP